MIVFWVVSGIAFVLYLCVQKFRHLTNTVLIWILAGLIEGLIWIEGRFGEGDIVLPKGFLEEKVTESSVLPSTLDTFVEPEEEGIGDEKSSVSPSGIDEKVLEKYGITPATLKMLSNYAKNYPEGMKEQKGTLEEISKPLATFLMSQAGTE